MNKRHNVCFRPWTEQKDYIKIIKQPHKGDDFCSSGIGMILGQQHMVLNKNCYDYVEILHVFFYAFGFHHNNTRPDRDNYVEIIDENILEDKVHNFNLFTGSRTFGVQYDGFSFGNGNTIESKVLFELMNKRSIPYLLGLTFINIVRIITSLELLFSGSLGSSRLFFFSWKFNDFNIYYFSAT